MNIRYCLCSFFLHVADYLMNLNYAVHLNNIFSALYMVFVAENYRIGHLYTRCSLYTLNEKNHNSLTVYKGF